VSLKMANTRPTGTRAQDKAPPSRCEARFYRTQPPLGRGGSKITDTVRLHEAAACRLLQEKGLDGPRRGWAVSR
jgi:hypothetical protein